jgi:hypothetical protein
VLEPVRTLLDPSSAGERGWPAALARLRRIGHSTGAAYAAGIAAALAVLGHPAHLPAGGEGSKARS